MKHACLFLALAAVARLTAAFIYVDARGGSDAADGTSPATAFATIQRAADLVQPGDTVRVGPGVYFETVQLRRAGTAEQPVKFEADRVESGRVVITGANRAIREQRSAWTLVDAALGLYVMEEASLTERPSRVLYSGTDLLPYPSVDELRRFVFNQPEKYPGTFHGFAWDAEQKKLYVRLHASGRYGPPDPNRHVMAVSPPNGRGHAGLQISGPQHYNFGVVTEGPAHVVLDGFTFETPGVAGVLVRGAGGVTVRNCWFTGCRTGVAGGRESADDARSTNAVIIEQCDYGQFPAFDDMLEVIERCRANPASEFTLWRQIYWWQRKGYSPDSMILYQNTYETGIASAIGRDWIIRHNKIHDTLDGLSSWGSSRSRGLLVHDNVFARIIDNAIEAENHAAGLTVRHNLIVDAFEPFSWQPLDGTPWPGPVAIHDNVVLTTPALQGVWRKAGWFPGVFKLGAAPANWNLPHMRDTPRTPLAAPAPGFEVWNNTIHAPGSRLFSHSGVAAVYENFNFRDNRITVDSLAGEQSSRVPGWGLGFANNVVEFREQPGGVEARLVAVEGGVVPQSPGVQPDASGWSPAAVGPQPR